MEHSLHLRIQAQPTDSTCGPTCLQAVYEYYGDELALPDVISQIGELTDGGTLAVQLACHALARGYTATIYTYNLLLFDPTWFTDSGEIAEPHALADRLRRQSELKSAGDPRVGLATKSYLRFLELGGQLRMEPLEEALIIRSLENASPVLCGLSATFLYQEARERPFPPNERGISSVPDDVGGAPVGHFVVLSGIDSVSRQVTVHDPHGLNPFSPDGCYQASLNVVSASILLSIVTYDANLLVIAPDRNQRPASTENLTQTNQQGEA